MYCLSCPEFQFDLIYEYASLAMEVEVEVRELFRDDQSEAEERKRIVRMDDQSETEELKRIVRMDNRRVSRHVDFVRNYIRNMLGRCQRIGKVIALTTSDALCDCRFGWRPPSQGFDFNARLVHVRPRQEYSISPRRRTLTYGSDGEAI
jgi:hypothetical protein